MKENLKIIVVLLIALFVFGYCSHDVNAEESTEEYPYVESFVYGGTSYDREGNVTATVTRNYIVKSAGEFDILAFKYYEDATSKGEAFIRVNCSFYIVPLNGNSNPVYVSDDGGATWNEHKLSSTKVARSADSDEYVNLSCYGGWHSLWITDMYNDGNGLYRSFSGYITHPCHFASSNWGVNEVLYNYANENTNVYNEQHSIEFDWETALENNTVALDGFCASYVGDTVATSWTGISSRVADISDYKNMYVLLSLGFKRAGESEIYHDTVFLKYSDMGGGVSVSKYLPADDMDLYSVKATPYYYSGDDLSNTCYSCIPSYVYFGPQSFDESMIDDNVNLGYLQDVTWTLDTTDTMPFTQYDIVTWSVDVPDDDTQIEVIIKDTDSGTQSTLHTYDGLIFYNDGRFTIDRVVTGADCHDEIYIRKIKYDYDRRVYYVGGWTRIICKPAGGNIITTGSMNKDDTNTFDKDIMSDDSYDYGMSIDGTYDDKLDWTDNVALEDMSINWLMDFMTGIVNSLGAVPKFIATIFGFLPTPIIYTLGGLLVICVLLRILGR